MPSETDPHPNSPQITLIDNAPTLESSLPPAQSENPELNPPSPNTNYSSFPSDSAPASPNTEFVVTIPATGPTERPKIRAPSPRDQMTPRPIQVVTGITGRHSNNSNDFSLFSHPPHPMHTTPQRRFRPPRPRVISRVRIVGSGRVQHYPMDTQRTGWKKMAANYETQYRLGVFGFAFSVDAQMPGNFGLWDQLAALQFIRLFGGNPEDITLLGHSAGAASVSALAISPHSRRKSKGSRKATVKFLYVTDLKQSNRFRI
ncbi:hypothetical protein niasHT_020400 [Heterodera trifolii]|uniref:Carboxylic ester hydrolase n=1 Tax=Heterodera trifolii TaxID=157864 RepID=A0ABD2JX77_9BILA